MPFQTCWSVQGGYLDANVFPVINFIMVPVFITTIRKISVCILKFYIIIIIRFKKNIGANLLFLKKKFSECDRGENDTR